MRPLLILSLLAAACSAVTVTPDTTPQSNVEVGMTVEASGTQAIKVNALVDQRRQEINTLRTKFRAANAKGSFLWGADSLSKSQQKEMDLAVQRLHEAYDDYLLYNSCLRYILSEYVDYEGIEKSTSDGSFSVLLGITVDFDSEPDFKIQSINLNVLDRGMDILRRKENIKEQTVRLVIDYPMRKDITREEYAKEYVDICFENMKVDRSWTAQPRDVDTWLSMDFGLHAISEMYQKTSEKIGQLETVFSTVDDTLLSIIKENVYGMREKEQELRNVNEDTYSKQTVFGAACISVYVVTSLVQLMLIRSLLKSKHLL